MAPIRSRGYAVLLVLAALLGVPLAAGAFGFLQAVSHLQTELFTDLPTSLGFHGEPVWWPLPLLAVAGVLVALAIRYLPGTGGHEPVEGIKTGGVVEPSELPGILLAALASLGLGAVIGPEAPLIALGGGLAALAARLAKRDADTKAIAVAAAAGSFAAVSALLGSPLLGAFLLMEASGLGGAALGIVLMPGLLAAGIGALVFVGLGSWTGLGTASLSITNPPSAANPDFAGFGWALVIGVASAFLGLAIRRSAQFLQQPVSRRRLLLTPVAGLGVAGLAIAYAEGTGRASNEVLFSGQSALSGLIDDSVRYSVGALILLAVCKGLAYALSMAAFRGGPVFPAMFLGAAGGIALSHAPGLPLGPGVAMGIGAMCVAMLKLPMTSVLLATLLLGRSGLTVMPLVIVAVVVSHVISIRLVPATVDSGEPAPAATAERGGGERA